MGTSPWVKREGTVGSAIFPQVSWKPKSEGGVGAAAFGAKIMQQCVIPHGGYILLALPPKTSPFQIVPWGMKRKVSTRLTTIEDLHSSQGSQRAVLVEGAQDFVCDISAVDGVNFGVEYRLTSDPPGSGTVLHTTMKSNPCTADKFKLDFGCQSPLGCSIPTCDCMPGTQKCKFNKCSEDVFDIPDKLSKYKSEYDRGNLDTPTIAPVKKFVNGHHFKSNHPMIHYCDAVNGTGDFTSYCYDYDDTNSSPYLRDPYKIQLRFFDA